MAFIPSNKSDLQTAINAWIVDETSTTSTYGDINTWNTSLITDMSDLFRNKTGFNGNIINWNVSNVTDMHRMFSGAHSFDRAIGNWNTSKVTNMYYMFRDARTFNQDINNWNVSNVTTMWAMFGGAYNFNQSLNSWDVSKVTNMGFLFYNALKFNGIIRDWNVSKVKYMDYMFQGATLFNQQLGTWNVENVTNMKGMFYYAESFNQPIGNWDTGSVTTFRRMFSFNPVFNQPIGNWNTSNVTDMHGMFYPLSAFNQVIGEWNTSQVTDMSYMFNGASVFNQYIRGWDTTTTSTNMGYMFNGANEMHNTYTGTPGFSNNPTNEFFNQPFDSNMYNTPPIANVDVIATTENISVTINVIGNDTDADGDSLTVLSSSATNGTVAIQSDQTIVYTPTTDFTGTDTMTYTISDGQGGTATSTVTVTVNVQINRAPVANVDTAVTNENTSTVINAISNDTDADDDTITVESASALNGSVLVQSDQSLLYTPNNDFYGIDTISYTIIDGQGGSANSTVAVSVNETPNTAPVANADTAITNKNTSVTFNVIGNDTDIDGDTITVYVATALNGTVTIQGDNTLVYTPDTGFAGTDTISYSINDGQGNSADSTVTVAVNTPPIANIDEIITNQNTNITVNVTSNDTDIDGDSLSVSSASALNGTVVIQNEKNIQYTPNTNYVGTDTISYTINDGRGGTANSTIVVVVNSQPVANIDEITINKNIATLINIISNDSDADGDSITLYSATANYGTVVNQNNGTILYTPNTDYVGTDIISYTIQDGRGGSATSVVNVTINTVPVANVDNIVTNENTAVNIDVISNDTDADSDSLAVSSASASNGSVVVQGDNTLLYIPTTDFTGTNLINYTITDGRGGYATSIVTVSVNSPPVANVDEIITNINTSVEINAISNDTDTDGDTITISSASAIIGTVAVQTNGLLLYTPSTDYIGSDTITYTIIDGRGGTSNSTVNISVNALPVANSDEITTNINTSVEINAISNDTDIDSDTITISSASANSGTVVIQNDGDILYIPPTDYTGSDIIVYTISDGRGGTANSSVAVTVNTHPVANIDEVITNKNTSVSINVIGNDTDADGDSLTVSSATATKGFTIIQSDSNILYTPNTNYIGNDTISYTIRDGKGGTSNSTVNVTVNTPPVANVDEILINQNISTIINVIANDTDADGDSIAVSSVSATNGNVVIQSDGTIKYTPNTNYTGVDTITYTISDGRGGTSSSTVTVTVNTPPVANIDEVITNTNTSISINAIGNDTDYEGDLLSVSSASATNGTVVIQSDGLLLYIPNTDYTGSDTIIYTITDGRGGSSDSTVTVNVDNTPPVANVDVTTTNKDTSVEINVTSNDTDADGDSLSISSATATNGTVVIQSDGQLYYTPTTSFTGLDTITYIITDGKGGTATSTVTVTVNAPPPTPPPVIINIPPAVINDTATTYYGESITIDVLKNDSDANGDILSVSAATAEHGTVTINDGETIEYTPNLNFFGTDIITYTANDDNGGETDGYVTLISEICFTSDALVLTDQGYIQIDQIDINKHTVHNQRIVAVTKTINKSPYLICIKKSALGENVPSQDTTMSKDHMLYYKEGKINANRLEELETNVCKVENTKSILYNVLLESYANMTVNNMMVETLHPDNIIAKMAIWNIANQLHEISNHTNSHD